MSQAVKLILPAYVLMCLVLGGSNNSIWLPAVLQIVAALLIGFVVLAAPSEQLPRPSRFVLGLTIAAVLLVALQLVPLPPEWWTKLPGRGPVREGYEALGIALPWLPLSLAPHGSIYAAFFALPFLAVLLGIVLVRQTDPRWFVGALVLGTIASVAIGAVQTAGGESWKIYSVTNTGAVGFFANRNFLGNLLVVNIPFAFALMGSATASSTHAGMTLRVVGAAYLLVIVIGIVLNRSLGAGLIAIPVCVASLALLQSGLSLKWHVVAMAALAVTAAAFLLMNGQLRSEIVGSDTVSIQTRVTIWSQTLKIVGDTFPVGTGLGSFREIYTFYEDPALVDRFYVNNAHNDYLELVLETGVPGILLICGFFIWWFGQAKQAWSSPNPDLIPRAATIASAAIMAHSLVDYPLRTAAISTVFAFCLGVMATSGRRSESNVHPSQRNMRHVRIA